MSGFIKILAVLYCLLITSAYAQGTRKVKTAESDTLKNKSPLTAGDVLNQQNKGDLNLLKHKISLDEMYELYFHYNKGFIDTGISNELNFSDLSVSPNNNSGSEDSLSYFNKNLSKILSLNYKEITKYDLGAFGEYLGISKELLAIILAILQ